MWDTMSVKSFFVDFKSAAEISSLTPQLNISSVRLINIWNPLEVELL